MTVSQPALNKFLIAAVAASVFTIGVALSRHGEMQTSALASSSTRHTTHAVPRATVPAQKTAAAPVVTAAQPVQVGTPAVAPTPAKPKTVSRPRAYTPLPPFPASPATGKGKLPPFPASNFGPIPAGAPGIAVPAPEVLSLTGVIQGDPKVAVLRLGDKRYFVKEGDSIGRDRVLKIGTNNVTLQHGRRTQTLRVGQS